MRSLLLFPLAVLFSVLSLSAQDDVGLFDFWKFYSDAGNSMYKTSCKLAFEQLDQRRSDIKNLKTVEDHLQRQAWVKDKLAEIIGPMPEKTPLNARVTGVIKRKGYRVEKVVYESMSGYYVTAALFLPVPRKGKLPAVIYASGHTVEGFRSPTYQHVIVNLVKKGFAVLAFDPIGQGERWQYLDKDQQMRFNSTTLEHSYPGAQCYISGYSPTKYFVWDGIRSVDYLLTRKEIDPQRIGMTGRSGGGTQTAYTAALDDRILAAAPECYITSMEYIMKSIGPQDAEQNLHLMIKEGLDHADLLEVRAPKPGLMITTTRDFFSIQGARETFEEVKQFYQGLGYDRGINMVEDDDVHTSTMRNREAMYEFFQETLSNPGSSEDLEVETFEEQELWVTETGKLATSLKGETLFSLNKKVAEDQIEQLRSTRQNASHLANLAAAVKQKSGFKYPGSFQTAIFSGRFNEEGYVLEKYLVPAREEYQLPVALFKPTTGDNQELVVIIDEQGLDHAVNQSELVHSLVQEGYSVLVTDLPGTGSLGPGYLKGDAYLDHTSFNQWFAGNLTGKSVVAMRAEDLARIVHFIKSELTNINSISALSVGALASTLLHYSVFDESFTRIGMIQPYLSYSEIALSPEYRPSFITSVVAGSLTAYDLPDLMASFSPRKILIVNPLGPNGDPLGEEGIRTTLLYPVEIYTSSEVSSNIKAVGGIDDAKVLEQVFGWMK